MLEDCLSGPRKGCDERVGLVLVSHRGHLRIVEGLLESILAESHLDRIILGHRQTLPMSLIWVRNFWRFRLNRESPVLMLPRLSEGFELDGVAVHRSNFAARQVLAHVGNPSAVVVGERFGEVALLLKAISNKTNTEVVIVPEGSGIEWDSQQFPWRCVNWSRSLVSSARSLIRLPTPRANSLVPALSLQRLMKFFWRIERILLSVFMGGRRVIYPSIDRASLLLSSWLSASPEDLEVESVVFVPLGEIGASLPEESRMLFIHAPYELDPAAWKACIRAGGSHHSPGIIVKLHRSSVGGDALIAAAEDLFPGKVTVLGGDLPVEKTLESAYFQRVVGLNSTVLLLAAANGRAREVIAVTKALSAHLDRTADPLISELREPFEDFELRYSGKLVFAT